MKYLGTSLIVALSIALLLAIGWVVVNVGRFAFFIIRDARRARRSSPRMMQHPEFGPLMLDAELWSGQIQCDGREIEFSIAGTEAGPDAGLSELLRDVIRRFAEFERAALCFIRSQEPELAYDLLCFESLDFLFEERPDFFGMGFTLPDDPEGCWRVEFEAGQPKFVGRDD